MSIDALEPKEVKSSGVDPEAEAVALNPQYNWDRAIPSFGAMNVDTEPRVDFRRMHDYRLATSVSVTPGLAPIL